VSTAEVDTQRRGIGVKRMRLVLLVVVCFCI